MPDVYVARTEADISRYVADAYGRKQPFEVYGFRTKRAAGRPTSLRASLSTSKLTGITHYAPQELVVSAKSGTPVHEIEHVLAQHNQELPFEPANLARIYGHDYQNASIGGVVAMNISGPRRILRGSARDYLLGVRAVNGYGELIKSGGRVLKNVTGVDLVRGLAGSWGTLGILTEVTFKVLPRAPESRTIVFVGLTDEAAVGVMSAALGTPYEVSGTVHLHGPFVERLADKSLAPSNATLTALRLEGAGPTLASKSERLRKLLSPFGDTFEFAYERSHSFWEDIRSCSFLSADYDKPLWRISIAPSKAAQVVQALQRLLSVNAAYEWSGGLLWLEVPETLDASVTEVRRVLAEYQADAMLMRGARNVRTNIEVFHPLPLAKMNLVQAVKQAFDPFGLLNPGRMYANV